MVQVRNNFQPDAGTQLVRNWPDKYTCGTDTVLWNIGWYTIGTLCWYDVGTQPVRVDGTRSVRCRDSWCIVGPRSVHTRDGWCLVGTGRLQKGTTASTFRKGAKSKSRERSGLSRKENKHVLERQEHEAEGDNAVRGVGVHAVEVDDNEVHNDGVREEAVVEVDDNGFGDEP